MTYHVGDRVLCYHGPKLYEAKIIQYKKEHDIEKYFVHYKGWKSKWDEWVEASRIVVFNNDGLLLKKKLSAEHASNDKKNFTDEKDNDSSKTEIPVLFKLGKNFKHFANFDWLQINKNLKILNAPVKFSVASFLRQYAQQHSEDRLKEFVEKFIKFLDVYIGKGLLYRQERLHYLPLDKSEGASALYGPEILIRFFVKLNIILQDYSNHPLLSEFSHDLYKISEYLFSYQRLLIMYRYLMRTLNNNDLESAYIIRSEHYESYYSIN